MTKDKCLCYNEVGKLDQEVVTTSPQLQGHEM